MVLDIPSDGRYRQTLKEINANANTRCAWAFSNDPAHDQINENWLLSSLGKGEQIDLLIFNVDQS